MFRIGAFAKRCGLTVKTLRHYDELGLLKPARVDEETGYRFYSAEQLLTIRRITGFKKQGLTLEMMRPLLSGPTSLTYAEHTLLEKRKELERQIQKAQLQLAEVDERLMRLGRQASPSEEEGFKLRSVAPVLVASVRQTLPMDQLCLLLDELKQYVSSQDEDSEREITILWHKRASCKEEPSDIEVAMPVSKPLPGHGRVKLQQLPGIQEAASYTHRCDPYEGSCRASEMLLSWIADKGYRSLETLPIREIYWTSDQDIYGQFRIAEAIIPVTRD
ncbi:MerR family transcriptional regulator [Paenibacillus sp. 1P07SE]|uniref:MerR family transcriptional regulator n=1 Tax=Paenibacillus sp. 1P07SE TaxID=3132209 RepID=UPI0039A65543